MLTLAAAQAGDAVQWFVLGAACISLARLLKRPLERSPLASTPHAIPWLAIALAGLWLAGVLVPRFWLAVHPNATPPEAGGELTALSPVLLALAGLENILTTAVLYLAIEVPRIASADRHPPRPSPEIVPQDSPEASGEELLLRQSGDPIEPPVAPAPSAVSNVPSPPTDTGREILLGIQFGLGAILLTTIVGLLAQMLRPREELHPYLELLIENRTGLTQLLVGIAAIVIAPLKEELLFRVILQGWLTDRLGRAGIVITAILFAFVHSLQDAPLLIPLALMLGVLYDQRRSYLGVVAAHATFNAANILMAMAMG